GEVQRRGPADVVAQQAVQLGAERRVVPRLHPRPLQLLQRGHERLGDVLASVGAEADLQAGAHGRPTLSAGRSPAATTAAANASIFAWSLTPGADSTPLATSTAN